METKDLYRRCKVCGMHMEPRTEGRAYIYYCPMHGKENIGKDTNTEIED